ncbi:MAG: ATPase, T2SS/T4P/T4SS family [Armatimonadota bacterium]
MKCDTCRELLTAYLKAELEEAQLAEVDTHLASCAECAHQCEHLRSALLTVDPQSEAPLVRIVNVILERAQRDRATDIEIRLAEDGTHVYYRIDGTMHEVMRLPEYVHRPLVNRIRVMANLLLADRRLPQEGRIQMQVQDKLMDLAVTIIPKALGEFICMHIKGEEEGEYGRPAIKCDTCRELMTAYLKAELEDAQKSEVEEHLSTCAECAKDCEGARRLLANFDQASGASVVQLVDEVISEAISSGASDIHVQPRNEQCAIRLRVDGVLHDLKVLPREQHQAVINRFKIMAGLNLTERTLPQEGRIPLKVEERGYDLRVSVVPSVLGETLVARIFDTSNAVFSFEKIHLVGEQREQLDKLIYAPMGTVFVTGPAGSGKTTTLYAILNQLNERDHNIMTIENPVAYQLDGLTQISVNPEAGLDFKTAMRHVMIQDPDIIMCGEIRDMETLQLCMQASIWGHLVLSTLYTLDAISAVRRILDVGAERFIVAQSFLGSTGQRLLRRICPDCKEEYEPTEAERAWLQAAGVEAPAKLWRGRGCNTCKQTGHRGRTVAYEIFYADDEIKDLLLKDTPIEQIEKVAATKVKPMKVSAAEMVVAGQISAAEAMRVMRYLPEY